MVILWWCVLLGYTVFVCCAGIPYWEVEPLCGAAVSSLTATLYSALQSHSYTTNCTLSVSAVPQVHYTRYTASTLSHSLNTKAGGRVFNHPADSVELVVSHTVNLQGTTRKN